MYSAELGRFVSRDPLGYVDGMSLYGGWFVPNEMDPSGNCGTKIPRPGYTPTSNGCGPANPGWLNTIIPEGFFASLGGYNFGPACDAHDICWGTCNADKNACDRAFLVGLKSQCDLWVDQLYGPGGAFSWIGPGRLKEMDRRACYADANMYHFAVANGGNSAYQAAQDEACICACPEYNEMPSMTAIPSNAYLCSLGFWP